MRKALIAVGIVAFLVLWFAVLVPAAERDREHKPSPGPYNSQIEPEIPEYDQSFW